MNEGALYHRARIENIQYFLKELEGPSHDAAGKGSPRELLKNGYIHPDITEQFNLRLRKLFGGVSSEPLTFWELTSYSTWFAMHPEKVAGTEVVTSSFHFPIKIKGTKEDIIRTIKGQPAQDTDLIRRVREIKAKLMNESGLAGLPDQEFLGSIGALSPDTALKITTEKQAVNNVLKLTEQALEGLGAVKKGDIYTFKHIIENYNKGISKDEIIAWVWYKRQSGEKMKGWDEYYIDETLSGTDGLGFLSKKGELHELVKTGNLFYASDEKDSKKKHLLPYPIFAFGNMYDRLLQVEKDKDEIISNFGKEIYDNHVKVINDAKPKPLSIMNPDYRERPKVLAISKFAQDFYVKNLREDSGVEIEETDVEEYSKEDGENRLYNLQWCFSSWLDYLNEKEKSVFKNVSAHQIWTYYIRGRNMGKSLADAEKQTIEKYSSIEGEELFTRFLHEVLTTGDQQKFDLLWNRTYNGFSSVSYHRIPVGFECSSRFKQFDFSFTPIQREGIAFMKAVGSGIIAYDVGVGKTIAAIITLANEMYSGKCSRPVIVVPNATYAKWIREIFGYTDEQGQYYAGVLSGTKITLNDWHNLGTKVVKDIELNKVVPHNSITMLTYEGFAKIGFGKEPMEELFTELSVILAQAEEEGDAAKSQRDLEKKYQGYRELIGVGQKGTIADIDTLGFDYIVIDEAHNFKNVFSYVPTDEEGVKRFKIQAADSARAKKAFFICNYIQRNFGSNVMLLTATPFTNNPIEVFSMLGLVGYDNLKKFGVYNLYSFMETFILQSLEYVNSYDGTIQQKHVVKAFNNRLVLQKLIHNHVNYKTGEEAGVKRPCKINLPKTHFSDPVTGQIRRLPVNEQITTYLIPNEAQQENQAAIISLAQTKGANMAERMKNIMRALAGSLDNALSPFIYDKEIPDSYKKFVDGSTKIKYAVDCIRSVKEWHEKRGEQPSGQVIYANRGKEYFPLIKEYLENEVGYQKKIKFQNTHVDEVEILTSDVSQDDRETVKDAFLEGTCKIIIGTATIREGIDLQRRGTVLYNLYPDWNPTDVKQLEGRIWRQGNQFGYVRVVMPLVQDSMDVFVFQKLEEKTSRVNDIWYRADRGNVLDVEALDPEEVKFALYTDMKELAKIVLERERKELNRQQLVLEANIKSIAELSYSLGEMKKYRAECIKQIQEWKLALQNFKTSVSDNKESWDDFSPAKMKEYTERSKELVKEIEQWQELAAQDDKFIIGLYNRLKESIFVLKNVIYDDSNFFDLFKQYFLTVSKAEKTILKQHGYTLETDFDIVGAELKKELSKVVKDIENLEAPEYVGKIVQEIARKKKESKVDGRTPSGAAQDFINLNYLLKYKFNETDIDGCKMPSPNGDGKEDAGKMNLTLRLKLKAMAIKAKLLL